MFPRLLLLISLAATIATPALARLPHVVLITVDTLRYDRLSIHGYARPTSPHIDALLEESARYTQARVAEPLTAPSMVSMMTSLYPHEHGTTRNGMTMRPRLLSLSRVLDKVGYETAGFVGNWTLKDRMTGLGFHFDDYHEVVSKKRWFGLFGGEAEADDLTAETLEWVKDYLAERSRPKPFLVWAHYVDPHAPYKLHKDMAERLGLPTRGDVKPEDRYDTEIAFVDQAIGDLLAGLEKLVPAEDLLIIFAADHGESLGEHDYWGHGRHLYDVNLRVPMAVRWKGEVKPRRIDALASNLDIAPTVLGLLGLPIPESFRGLDWTPILRGKAEPPSPDTRVTHHQAHKGAVHGGTQAERESGLLEVGLVEAGRKRIFRLKGKTHRIFNLADDPGENKNLAAVDSALGEDLAEWMHTVEGGLEEIQKLPPPTLSDGDIEQLRSLGYID